jgi:hypothetical protein
MVLNKTIMVLRSRGKAKRDDGMPQIVQVSDSTVALFVREYFDVGFLKTKPMLANIRDLK